MSGGEAPGAPPPVRRYRIECLGGPWWDGLPCVRFVDLAETQSLYDLHEGIQAAIAFDGEYPFYFFRAEAPEGPREMVPETFSPHPVREEVDDDAYETIGAFASVPPADGGERLFYVFLGAGGDWFFEVSAAEPGPVPRMPGAFYPETVESLSIGPDPMQYGHDLDDFAEAEEDLLPAPPDGPGEDAGAPPPDGDYGDGEDEEDGW